MIGQSLIYGDSHKNYCVAVVIPDIAWVMPWARQKGIKGDFATIVKNKEVERLITEFIDRLAQSNKLSALEKPHKVHIGVITFSVENNTVTPTQKLKRQEAIHLY